MFVYFALAIFCYTLAISARGVEVQIKQGKLIGFEKHSRNGTKFYAFRGIPYAKPPIGSLRFRPPQEPDGWTGVLNITGSVPKCIQIEIIAKGAKLSNGSENCLFLNVFTPEVNPEANIPVLVWIHGGAFLMGEGDVHDPKYFMDRKIVIVTINYRLGLFGFLSASDEELPGNYGVKDQVAALKWIRNNIRDFGGDPDKVTIFGESAGGASVHWLMHSPLAKGLFHGAISQSGTALASWTEICPRAARIRAFFLGLTMGCPTENTKQMAECLREIPAEKLRESTKKLFISDEALISVPFAIVKEPKSAREAFVTESPWDSAPVAEVPWITGITSGEGILMVSGLLQSNATKLHEFAKNYDKFIYGTTAMIKMSDYDRRIELWNKLKKYYFGEMPITEGNESVQHLIDFFTDLIFLHSMMEALNRYQGRKYLYYYDHESDITVSMLIGHRMKGVCHGDDVFPLFKYRPLPMEAKGKDAVVSKKMIDLWVNFAYSGNPNGNDQQLWSPMTEKGEYLHMKTTSFDMDEGLIQERYKFWKSLNLRQSCGKMLPRKLTKTN